MTDGAALEADPPIVVSLTLPGSASLGAFQAGAVAALSVAIQELRSMGHPMRISAIGGASAGSIVAALFAHGLLTGRDVPELMRTAWVNEVDMTVLRSTDPDAPLSFDQLRAALVEFIDDETRFPYRRHEPASDPIVLHVGLTSLLGFEAELDESLGLSYADWAEFELKPGHSPTELHEADGFSLLDAVLSSASHPLGFQPRMLDRSDERDTYEQKGVLNLPDPAKLWYTDGGLVESRPVGRILEASRRVAAQDVPRLHIVVDPRSSGPRAAEEWGDPGADRSWLDGVRRALSIVPTQALHDDLRGVATRNKQLEALPALLDELDPQASVDRDELESKLREWAGLADKTKVRIETISPHSTSSGGDGGLLAGDFVGAFGGFLDESIRASDFATGWSATSDWLLDGLSHADIDDHVVKDVCTAVDAAWDEDWRNPSHTADGISKLGAAGRLRLMMLIGQFARVLVRAARPKFDLPSVRSLRPGGSP